MLKTLSILIVSFLLAKILSAGQTGDNPVKKAAKQHSIMVSSYIHHVSDIDIKDQQYKIEIWLYLSTTDSIWGWDSLVHQFQVNGAKEINLEVVPQYHRSNTLKVYDSTIHDSVYRKVIKINCVMNQDWDVDNYPFDEQKLTITCYTIRPLERLLLIPTKPRIGYSCNGSDLGKNIENGWFIVGDSVNVASVVQKDIFETDKQYSAIQFTMTISRKQIVALFFKLFIGMYVSFLVAFIALFINVSHVEPRFGLPVGGLFAAIGNKYIMESILPPSSEFTIVDSLHTYTIIAILLIIIFSAASLKLAHYHEPGRSEFSARFPLGYRQMNWIDKKGTKLILIGYILLNVVSILWGLIHERMVVLISWNT